MSADFISAPFKAFLHEHSQPPYLHVVMEAGDGPFDGEAPLGNFSFADIAALVLLAGQAWPGGPGVTVRYVIECRSPGKDRKWTTVWSCAADDDASDGISEKGASGDFAAKTLAAFRADKDLEWQLVRRTTLTADTPAGEED